MNYSEKLKDPRWQRKRLEILQRDDFSCRICGDNESPLMVHHYKYSGENPWDIEEKYLVTLCENCHEFEHETIKGNKKLLEETMMGLESDCYRTIASIINSIKNKVKVPPNVVLDILESCFIYVPDFFENQIAEFYFNHIKKSKQDIKD